MLVLCIIGIPRYEIGIRSSDKDVFKGVVYHVKTSFESMGRKFYTLLGRDEKTAYDSAQFVELPSQVTRKLLKKNKK